MSIVKPNNQALVLLASIIVGILVMLIQPSLANAVAGIKVTDIGTVCEEDLNEDGFVNLLDYSLLVGSFLRKPFKLPRADINKDGEVNIFDYSRLVKKFNQLCQAIESPPSGVLTPDVNVTPEGGSTPQGGVTPMSSPTPMISPTPASSSSPKINPSPTSDVSDQKVFRPEDNAGSTTVITPDVGSE
jgi:hypothetical protein